MNNISIDEIIALNNNVVNPEEYFKFLNIGNVIDDIIEKFNLPEKLKMQNGNLIRTNEPKNEDLTYSVSFFNQLIFKITFRKKASSFVEFSPVFSEFCIDAIIENKSKFLKYNMDIPGFIEKFNSIVGNIINSELKKVHGESFGCCSQYEVCSDKKECAHDDIEFYLSCQYRLNLINGHIFYGKNRTENGFFRGK